jgi:hypothetical protein
VSCNNTSKLTMLGNDEIKLSGSVQRQSIKPEVSRSMPVVYSLLTKRRAVDFCRMHSSLPPLP